METKPLDTSWVKAWPTQFKVITQTFGSRPDYYVQFALPGHEGVDIRAYEGTQVYTIGSGTVYRYEPDEYASNYGRHIRIDHANGFRTIYAHLSAGLVGAGYKVKAGEMIGLAGRTGNTAAAHLHLMMKHDLALLGGAMYEGYPYSIIDPTPYLDSVR